MPTSEAQLITSLHRPVFSVLEDFDGSGLPQVIVCNFGKNLGSLSLYKKKINHHPLWSMCFSLCLVQQSVLLQI
jgi:hypothetical protein